MINGLPTIFEVLTGTPKKQQKEKTPHSNKSSKSNSKLPSSSQRSQSQQSQRHRDEEVQKTIENMCLELENERSERLRIEEERHNERLRMEVEHTKLAEQQKADRENFQALLSMIMAMVKGNEANHNGNG